MRAHQLEFTGYDEAIDDNEDTSVGTRILLSCPSVVSLPRARPLSTRPQCSGAGSAAAWTAAGSGVAAVLMSEGSGCFASLGVTL